MASITNPNWEPLVLPSGHVVPGRGTLETTNEVLQNRDNEMVLLGSIRAGLFPVVYDPPPAEEAAEVVPDEAAMAEEAPTEPEAKKPAPKAKS